MFVPVSRILTILMAGVLCFGMLVPLALRSHAVPLAVAVGAVFLLYLVANVALWQRMKRRT